MLLETTGSSFDTLLAVYTGSTVSNLVLVASNDDGTDGALAELTFQAQAAIAGLKHGLGHETAITVVKAPPGQPQFAPAVIG